MAENCRLHGISFAELPYLTMGDEVIVIREEGERWDSEARPAYSVRLEGCHIGYIPLVETLKEEAMRARDGYSKRWKDEFESLTKEELRAVAQSINETGDAVTFHEWEFVGTENSKQIVRGKLDECCIVEVVRDYLYCEIMRNNLVPRGVLLPLYYDKEEGRNYSEIGEVCSISVRFNDIM